MDCGGEKAFFLSSIHNIVGKLLFSFWVALLQKCLCFSGRRFPGKKGYFLISCRVAYDIILCENVKVMIKSEHNPLPIHSYVTKVRKSKNIENPTFSLERQTNRVEVLLS